MKRKPIYILVLFLSLPLSGLFAQAYSVIYPSSPPPEDAGLHALARHFDSVIKDALKKTFGNKFVTGFVRSPVSFNIRSTLSRPEKLSLDFIVEKSMQDTDPNNIVNASFLFDFDQKDSLADHLRSKVINEEFVRLLDGHGSDDFDEKCEAYRQGIAITGELSRATVDTRTTVQPIWDKAIPDDGAIYPGSLEINPSLKKVRLQRRDKEFDFRLYEKEVQIDQAETMPDLDKEIKAYLDNINIRYEVNGGGKSSGKMNLSAGTGEVTEYHVKYVAVADYRPMMDMEIEIISPSTEKTYKVRKIPEYDFALKSHTITPDALVCTFDENTSIPHDLSVYNLENAPAEKNMSHYLYINKEIADFINANNGNLVMDQTGFRMKISLVRNNARLGTRYEDALQDPGAQAENLLYVLGDVIRRGKQVVAVSGTQGKQMPFPKLPNPINPAEADYYIRMDFSVDNPTSSGKENDILLFVKDFAIKRENTANGISDPDALRKYLEESLNTIRPEDCLDVVKILIYIGDLFLVNKYLKKYEDYLQERKLLNIRNNKYRMQLYRNFAVYYYSSRFAPDYSGTARMEWPDEKEMNDPADKDINAMREAIRSVSENLEEILLPENVLFSLQKQRGASGSSVRYNFFNVSSKSFCRRMIERSGISGDDKGFLFGIFEL